MQTPQVPNPGIQNTARILKVFEYFFKRPNTFAVNSFEYVFRIRNTIILFTKPVIGTAVYGRCVRAPRQNLRDK